MGYLTLSLVFTLLLFFVKKSFTPTLPYIEITISLSFIIIIAFFVGKFFKQLGFPQITGYLITGMLLSPYSFGLLSKNTVQELDFIKEIAITFIALQSGMEMKMSFIKKYGRDVLFLTASIAVTAFTGLFIFSMLFLKQITNMYFVGSILLGILLILKSPLSTIAVIKESKTDTVFGDKILGVAILKDVIVIVIFASIVPFLSGASPTVISVMIELLGSIGLGIAISILIILYMKHVKSEFHVFLFVVAFLVSQASFIHLDPLIISIIIGFSVQNFTLYNKDFQRVLDEMSPIIYLLFFTLADAGINLHVVLQLLPITLGLIGVKWIFTELGIIFATKDKLLRKFGTFGLLNQSGLSLVLVVLVEEAFPAVGEIVKGIVISVIVITDLFAPVLFKKSLMVASTVESKKVARKL